MKKKVKKWKKWGTVKFFWIFVASFVIAWMTLSLMTIRPAESVARVIDGDTIVMNDGHHVRLLGIDAPERGKDGSQEPTVVIETLLKNKKVWLEGDRVAIDKYGRTLAWVWVGCESDPQFLADSYMTVKSSKELRENPIGCRKGILVNELMVKMGLVKTDFPSGQGELKYQTRLEALAK